MTHVSEEDVDEMVRVVRERYREGKTADVGGVPSRDIAREVDWSIKAIESHLDADTRVICRTGVDWSIGPMTTWMPHADGPDDEPADDGEADSDREPPEEPLIADGGMAEAATTTWSELTGFQRDLLKAIARVERAAETPYGLKIRSQIERQLGEEVNHGRLYPNLRHLGETPFVDIESVDGRTNAYRLTPVGMDALRYEAWQLADAAGVTDEMEAATDGGSR